MPNIITHYNFCNNRVNDDLKKIALLGSQGPDPFFFSLTAFKLSSKKYSSLASSMHRMDPYRMYKYMIDYALSKSGKERDILFSFIRGLMYHYCVDRNCHPYVFYLTGFKTEENKGKLKKKLSHSGFETYIDVLLSQKYGIKVNPVETIKAPEEQIQLVSVMIYHFVKDVLNIDNMDSSSYYDCVKGMQRFQKLVYSPSGIKKKIYSIFLRKTPLDDMCMPKEVKYNDVLDCMNEKKQVWLEPDSGKERNDTFYEVLDMATKDGDVVDEILQLAYNGKNYDKKLKEFTNEINHHGFNPDDKKKYYSLITNRLKK